ncbi:hypothetical protein DO70_3981 [Burkholderia pseudomallei]|nr:hypothetical protein DO70_3981 [Burkholderia pseudomallei]
MSISNRHYAYIIQHTSIVTLKNIEQEILGHYVLNENQILVCSHYTR